MNRKWNVAYEEQNQRARSSLTMVRALEDVCLVCNSVQDQDTFIYSRRIASRVRYVR